jgi:hypothetical protein
MLTGQETSALRFFEPLRRFTPDILECIRRLRFSRCTLRASYVPYPEIFALATRV